MVSDWDGRHGWRSRLRCRRPGVLDDADARRACICDGRNWRRLLVSTRGAVDKHEEDQANLTYSRLHHSGQYDRNDRRPVALPRRWVVWNACEALPSQYRGSGAPEGSGYGLSPAAWGATSLMDTTLRPINEHLSSRAEQPLRQVHPDPDLPGRPVAVYRHGGGALGEDGFHADHRLAAAPLRQDPRPMAAAWRHIKARPSRLSPRSLRALYEIPDRLRQFIRIRLHRCQPVHPGEERSAKPPITASGVPLEETPGGFPC